MFTKLGSGVLGEAHFLRRPSVPGHTGGPLGLSANLGPTGRIATPLEATPTSPLLASPPCCVRTPSRRLTRLARTYQYPPRKPYVLGLPVADPIQVDRKSTRLNSSHDQI